LLSKVPGESRRQPQRNEPGICRISSENKQAPAEYCEGKLQKAAKQYRYYHDDKNWPSVRIVRGILLGSSNYDIQRNKEMIKKKVRPAEAAASALEGRGGAARDFPASALRAWLADLFSFSLNFTHNPKKL
jgi:hypothetical protein